MINNISRRQFISTAGAAAGLAALAYAGINSGWGENNPEIDFGDIEKVDLKTDVLVIGSGMAGLFAAIKAHDSGVNTLMVSKGRLGSSGQTPFAKGMFEFDPVKSGVSLDEFVEKVGISAMGSNNPVYTRQMAQHSAARIAELRSWGFFDSPLYNKAFSKPITERGIEVVERVTITHLIKENNRIVGAAGFSIDEKKAYFFKAKSVILCTGAGGFKPNGFPINDLTHDGTVMAYEIGARVTGKEWNDGHPGRANNPAACFDGWGDMFEKKPSSSTEVSIRHDLGVDGNYQAYIGGNPTQMGRPSESNEKISGGPVRPEGLDDMQKQDRRPPSDGEDRRGGKPQGEPPDGKRKGNGPPNDNGKGNPPPGMGGSTVGGSSAGMAIHKSEGLVPIDDKCASDIPGLYAAGDALGSYMAGAIYTQVGSSLTGSAVQGAIAGEAAAEYSKNVRTKTISDSKISDIKEEIFAPLNRDKGYSPAWVTQTLQGIMIPNFILYIKKENLLNAALAYIEELRDHHMPMLRAADLHELRLAHETKNMIISAEMKLRASLMRTESRCSHYRLDYPDVDDQNWRAWINIYKGVDGKMKLERQEWS